MSRRAASLTALAAFLAVAALLGVQFWQQYLYTSRILGVEVSRAEDGLRVDRVQRGSPAHRFGVRRGDVIVAADGTAIHSADDYIALARKFRPHESIRLTLLRGHRRVRVPVRLGMPFPWVLAVLTAVTALAYLFLGILTWFQLDRDPRARLLAFFSLAVALELAVPTGTPASMTWMIAGTVWYYLISGLQIGLLLHLASVIPRPLPWLERRPWLARVYYAIGMSLGLGVTIVFLGETFGGWSLPFTAASADFAVFGVGLPVWAFTVIGILAYQAKRASGLRERQHALLVLVSLLPWAFFSLGFEIAEAMGYAAPTWAAIAQLLVLLPYPFAVFVAIYRLHLFDIELAVKRSLVYTAITVVLVGVFYAILGLGGLFLSRVLGKDPNSMWFISAATLLLGLLFWPLRNVIQRLVDRRLFPERIALRQRLVKAVAGLPALGDVTAIGRHLVREVSSAFGVRPTTLFVSDPSSGVLLTLASNLPGASQTLGRSILIDPHDAGAAMLVKAGRPMRTRHLATVSRPFAQRLEQLEATVACGLVADGRLVGLLAVGPKVNGEPFSSEELDLLNLFSHHSATVLQNVQLFHSATYEGLTGILRREAILRTLEQERDRAQRYRRPLTVAMADLDLFKRVNDQHGHLAGDALLQRVAQTLKTNLRTTDAVGRYGGEEFLMVLPETTLSGACLVADKLRQKVAEIRLPVSPTETLRITVSIGLASFSPEQDAVAPSSRELIEAADRQLLLAKRSGRNRVMPDVGVGEAAGPPSAR